MAEPPAHLPQVHKPVSILCFQVLPCPESNDDQVRILVDGVDIIETFWGDDLGIDPVEFFAQPSLRSDGELLISRCCCGVVGCGDGTVTVHMPGDQVFWISSNEPRFRHAFQRDSYLEEVNRAYKDFSWENPRRQMERRVSDLDFVPLFKNNLYFQWVSGRIQRQIISLSFFSTIENKQRIVHLPWKSDDPHEAVGIVAEWIKEQWEK
jgi:hypothetical protein